jgi:hypothetical protein
MSGYTTTPNYGLLKPSVNGDDDQWGTHLNQDMDILDTQLKSVANSVPTGGPFLPIAGGAMTGAVALAGVSTAPLAPPGNNTTQIASTAFVTAAMPSASSTTPTMNGTAAVGTGTTWARADHVHPSDTSRLALAGGTMTGALVLSADPAANLNPVTLQYYNAHASATTPLMNAVAAIGTSLNFARADHVHPSDTTRLTDAPADSKTYGRLNNAWAQVATATPISDTPPGGPQIGSAWFDSVGLQQYIYYNDGNSNQWVPVVNQAASVTAALSTAQTDQTIQNNVGRNLLHNSMFNIQQRGTGPWTTGTGTYTCDRWRISGSLDTFSYSMATLTDADRAAIGDEAARFSLQNVFTGSATANAYNQIRQAVEGVRRLSGKTAIISFYARASSGTPKIGLSYQQSFGTGGSPSASVYNSIGATSNLNATWTRYSFTVSYPSASGKTLGTNGDDFSELTFTYSDVSNQASTGVGQQSGTVQLWGVQLEIGSVATPLEKIDPQQDLAKCQRFYQTIANITIINATASGNFGGSIPQTYVFPVQMRAIPSTSGITYNGGSPNGGISYASLSASGFQFYSSSAITGGIGNYNNFSGYVSADL